ncbi:N-glycosylase/DNA lyase [Phlyctochytrium arcticum]|nr:N-glycosylase/DNA lyase [Phlyctochytrium arcticum]
MSLASDWHSLSVPSNELRLDTTLQCGQAFRWIKTGENEWTCALWDRLVSLTQTDNDVLFRTHPPSDPAITSALLNDYFQLHINLGELYADWSKRDANFRKRAVNFQGIRILRQDVVENIFSFICTSNNNIPRITSMIHNLCLTYGSYVGTHPSNPALRFHAFPTVSSLAGPDVEAKLRELGFGYRAKYIVASARLILENEKLYQESSPRADELKTEKAICPRTPHSEWLHSLRTLSYPETRTHLLTLTGVGPKVADCICLFSMDKHDVVPVDTHVIQIARRDYNIKAGKGATGTAAGKAELEMVARRLKDIFGAYAGWSHSVLFAADLNRFSDRAAKKAITTIKTEVEVKVDVKVETATATKESTQSVTKRKRTYETIKTESSASPFLDYRRVKSDRKRDVKEETTRRTITTTTLSVCDIMAQQSTTISRRRSTRKLNVIVA